MKCAHCDANVDGNPRICPDCGRTLPTSAGGDLHDGGANGRGVENDQNRSRGGWNASDSDSASSSDRDAGGGGWTTRGGDGRTDQGGEIRTAEADEQLLQDTQDKLEFPVKFPQSGGWAPVATAGLMLLLSFLVVPFFLFVGYCSRICRAAARGRREAPAFDDWGGLLKEGFLFSVAVFGFGIVTTIALAIPFVLSEAMGTPALVAVVVPVYLLGGYLVRAVMTLYAVTLDFGATFSPSNVWSFAFTGEYFVAFLAEIALTLALGIVAGIAIFTLVGWIWVYAYIFVASAALWGQLFYTVDTSDLDLPTDEDTVDGGVGAPA